MIFTSGTGAGAGATGLTSGTVGRGAATVDVRGRGAFAFFFAALDAFLTILLAAGRVLRLTFRPRAAFFRVLPTLRFAAFFFFAMRVSPNRSRCRACEQWISSGTRAVWNLPPGCGLVHIVGADRVRWEMVRRRAPTSYVCHSRSSNREPVRQFVQIRRQYGETFL
jgi:predicted RNA-binding Zn-ribbon protein involved in translation (DUF1610 family)